MRSPRESTGPSNEPGPIVAVRQSPSLPARFFWNRSRAVAPTTSIYFDDHVTDIDGNEVETAGASDDPNTRDIIFLSKPNNDFLDLRSLVFGHKPAQPGVVPSTKSSGAVTDTSQGPVAGSAITRRPRNPVKRRLRAKEELCLTLPRSGSRPKKSWFLAPGLVGREGGEHILVATKDPSMDPVHAEISVEGDDYLLRDHHSTGGTFLCLSTIHRHYPQRDGFRLRRGDTFYVGLTTRVTIEEIVTEIAPPIDETKDRRRMSSARYSEGDSDQKLTSGLTPQSRDGSARASSERLPPPCLGSRNHSLTTLVEREGEGEIATAEDGAQTTARKVQQELSPKRRVRFADTLPSASDGSTVLGSRYQRTRSKPKPPPYPRYRPITITLSIVDTACNGSTTAEPRRVNLCGSEGGSTARNRKDVFLLGSAAFCDVHLQAEDIHPVHARITFDGFFFLLQDLSFDENPQRKTRVSLLTPTRLARGDILLLGKCELHVTTISKAFRGRDRDMKEVAIRCRLLRVSKRKTRAPGKFVTVGFRHQMQESFVFGKGRDCQAQMFTTALAVEQFSVQLDHGACMMTPKAAGINQGTYFLLGRDCMPHATERVSDLVRYSSKALMLVEGCVFKCGNTELEVVYVKNAGGSNGDESSRSPRSQRSVQDTDEVFENATLLGNLPWLQQIAYDRKLIQNVARRGRRLTMEPGDVIYDEGDPATFLFIVIEGDVELASNVWTGSVGSARCNSNDAIPQEHEPRRMTMRLESMSFGVLPEPFNTLPTVESTDPPVNDDRDVLLEQVGAGSFFGEICLQGPCMEYAESARAAGEHGCALLVFDREDLVGYFGMYMDIIRPHLAFETQREILHCLRLHVPWLSSLSYHDIRMLAARAERLEFAPGEILVENGKVIVPGSTFSESLGHEQDASQQQREGLLLLVRGKALLTRPKDRGSRRPSLRQKLRQRRSSLSVVSAFASVIDTDGNFAADSRELRTQASDENVGGEDEVSPVTRTDENVSEVERIDDEEKIEDGVASGDSGEVIDEATETMDIGQEEWWRPAEPLTLLPSTQGAEAANSKVITLEARSRVECFFLDATHVAHLANGSAPFNPNEMANNDDERNEPLDDQNRVKPLLLRKPTNRRSSFAAMNQRLQSSQIITKGLNAASAEDEDGDGGGDDRSGGDEDEASPSRKWRRKKRNKNVLEKTLAETQDDAELTNALVVYVLSGANRGDVHVVRNVASLGAIKSGADIELNDRYVSNSHAVIEHHDGRYWLYDDCSEWGTFVRLEENNPVEIHPGDVFLAGEVEFMCLGTFPERKRQLNCCVQ